ncbi:DUF4149 domain-containing protein [Helicobacter mesocricetorum]|uniref:DUF4149 domain-containing protein n=1 Tax=Helicobacter mesocricetorum TaxID=87012 RepID=UPI000CF059C2|nr:DUF4149 domain-containing protein [Helicobacter mesocricetorum]
MQYLFKLCPYFLALYLLLIGISLGAALASGAFTAPSIFRAAEIVQNLEITTFQSGILMTSIFIKLNFLLNILALYIIIYETILSFYKEKFTPLLGLINVILIFLFTLYYTPLIVEAQISGEDSLYNESFVAMHHQSVLVFKTLIIGLCVLFIYRVLKVINSGYKGK